MLRFLNLRLCLMALLVAMAACSAHSRVIRSYASAPASLDEPIAFVVDSIDFRPDLTRVYGTLTGKPNTSNRIDAASLVTPSGTLEATDIDGVDFRRYFQWEEDGRIEVELDFPPSKAPSGLKMMTVRGSATFNLAPRK